MKFSPGDKAIIVGGINERHRVHIGEVVTLIEYIEGPLYQNVGGIIVRAADPGVWITDISHVDEGPFFKSTDLGYRNCDLKPYYDGNERVSWDQCVWKPTRKTEDV